MRILRKSPTLPRQATLREGWARRDSAVCGRRGWLLHLRWWLGYCGRVGVPDAVEGHQARLIEHVEFVGVVLVHD